MNDGREEVNCDLMECKIIVNKWISFCDKIAVFIKTITRGTIPLREDRALSENAGFNYELLIKNDKCWINKLISMKCDC